MHRVSTTFSASSHKAPNFRALSSWFADNLISQKGGFGDLFAFHITFSARVTQPGSFGSKYGLPENCTCLPPTRPHALWSCYFVTIDRHWSVTGGRVWKEFVTREVWNSWNKIKRFNCRPFIRPISSFFGNLLVQLGGPEVSLLRTTESLAGLTIFKQGD